MASSKKVKSARSGLRTGPRSARGPEKSAPAKISFKISDAEREALTRGLRVGATQLQAAQFAGLSAERWHELVNAAREGDADAREVLKHCELVEAQTATVLSGLVLHHAKAQDNPQSWRAAAWMLERRFPDVLKAQPSSAPAAPGFTVAQVAEIIREIANIVQDVVQDEFTRERLRSKMADLTRGLHGRAS